MQTAFILVFILALASPVAHAVPLATVKDACDEAMENGAELACGLANWDDGYTLLLRLFMEKGKTTPEVQKKSERAMRAIMQEFLRSGGKWIDQRTIRSSDGVLVQRTCSVPKGNASLFCRDWRPVDPTWSVNEKWAPLEKKKPKR